jgi:WD40 repeat protein
VIGPPYEPKPRPTSVAAAGPRLAITSDDAGNVRRWDVRNAPEPARLDAEYTKHDRKAAYVTASTAADRLFSASYHGRVVVSDLSKPKYRYAFDDHHLSGGPHTEVWAIAVTADGSHALSATNRGEIRYWRTDKGVTVGHPFAYNEDAIGSLAFLPWDENFFLSTHGDGKIHVWDFTRKDRPRLVKADEMSHGNGHLVNSVAVTRTKLAVSGSLDMTVRLWDLSVSPPTQTIMPGGAHTDFVWRTAVSPDGKWAASVGQDQKVIRWDLAARKFDSAKEEKGGVMGVAFLDGGKLVYTTGAVEGKEPQVKLF